MKRSLQILIVMFALGMLGAYVVYSQLQQNRTVAPTSKGGTMIQPGSQVTISNEFPKPNPRVVLSGTKSMSGAPFALPQPFGGEAGQSNANQLLAPLKARPTPSPRSQPRKIETVTIPIQPWTEEPPVTTQAPPDIFFYGSKSGAVFRPDDTSGLAKVFTRPISIPPAKEIGTNDPHSLNANGSAESSAP